MYKVAKILLCCMLLWVQPLRGETTQEIARIVESKVMQHASVGVCIVDVATGETVAAYDPDRALTPASITKVVTAATVMQLYADTARWYTSVGYTGHVGDNGTLHGDVVIKGCIDPSLSAERSCRATTAFLDSVASALRRAGIVTIDGDIVADASICEKGGGTSQWLEEDRGWYYGAGCYGLNYRNNRYDLWLQTGAERSVPEIVATSLPMPMITYRNYLTVGKSDSSFVAINPYTGDCLLTGIVPAHQERFKLPCSMPDPPRVLAHEMKCHLQQAGIAVKGNPMTRLMRHDAGGDTAEMTEVLLRFPSDRLSAMVETMLWHSDNLYAEALLRYVALSCDSVAKVSTALAVERDLWQRAGLDVDAMQLYDGCGLARKNSLTPRFIASLLAKACHIPALGQPFVSLFPQAGKDGTVRNFLARKPLAGTLRLKSGSMGGVLCYAGYYTEGSRTYAVVLMSNHHTCRNATVRELFGKVLRAVLGK